MVAHEATIRLTLRSPLAQAGCATRLTEWFAAPIATCVYGGVQLSAAKIESFD